MLEQGLAYGLGKPVIILKDKATKAISDLGSIEYIEYSHAGDLQQKLYKALDTKIKYADCVNEYEIKIDIEKATI